MLNIKPYEGLPVSVARQQAIIDVVNTKLAANPRQSFCFMGKPGTGKTTIMKAIQEYAANQKRSGRTTTTPLVSEVVTLADWHTRNHAMIMEKLAPSFISSNKIREIATDNKLWTSAGRAEPPHSLHFFLDEIDSQPSTTDYTRANWQSFINACYDNSARNGGRTGNATDIVQLVVAMNTTWAEFVNMYGQHVSRRIAEMCVVVDLDRESPVQASPASCSPTVVKLDRDIERLVMQ
jgi:Cdc6-like AAA superfamily ATPase